MAEKYYGKRKSKSIAKPGFGGDFSMEQAGMPSEKIMKNYPKASYGGPEGYGDDINSIDMMAADNARMMKKSMGRK